MPYSLFGTKFRRTELLAKLREDGKAYLNGVFKDILKEEVEKGSYQEMRLQIDFCEGIKAGASIVFNVLIIKLLEMEQWSSIKRVFICTDASGDNPGCFLVEKSDFQNKKLNLSGKLGSIVNIQFGTFSKYEEDQFERVCGIYGDYLRKMAKK